MKRTQLNPNAPETNKELVRKTKKVTKKLSPDLSKQPHQKIKNGNVVMVIYRETKNELKTALKVRLNQGWEIV